MASSWNFYNTTQHWSYNNNNNKNDNNNSNINNNNNNTLTRNYNVQPPTMYNYPAETTNNDPHQQPCHQTSQYFAQIPNPQNYYIPRYDVTTQPVDNPSYYTSIQQYNLTDTLTKKQYVGPDVLYKCTESPVGSIPNSPILGGSALLGQNIAECQGTFYSNYSNYQGEQSNYANTGPSFSQGCECACNPR
ncbi:hypothetical protein ACHWQZ_G005658 [Mnemiopsis leidyi]